MKKMVMNIWLQLANIPLRRFLIYEFMKKMVMNDKEYTIFSKI